MSDGLEHRHRNRNCSFHDPLSAPQAALTCLVQIIEFKAGEGHSQPLSAECRIEIINKSVFYSWFSLELMGLKNMCSNFFFTNEVVKGCFEATPLLAAGTWT